mgnify:CR=1 FL=1
MEHEHNINSEHNNRRAWVSIAVGIIIVIVFILYMITFTVRKGEYAVLKTFGKVTRTIKEPGLYWKFPLAQKAVIHDSRLHTSEDGMLEETFTRDGKPIIVMTFFNWKIEDIERYDNSFGSSFDQAERALQTIVRAAKGEVFGQSAFNDFITVENKNTGSSANKMRFELIEQKILEKAQKQALAEIGVNITQVGVKRLILPEAVSQKVFDRMKSERQALAKKSISEGEGEAINIKSRAERDRNLILYTAQARAKSIRAEGEKAAAEYYNVFAAEPELHMFLKSLESLRLLVKKSTIIIDTSSLPFQLLGRDAIPLLNDGKADKESK